MIIFLSIVLYATPFKTITVGFTREIRHKNLIEIVKGNMYYEFAGKLMLKINDPVKQWMIFNDDKEDLIVYYPDKKKAFKIKSENPISVPLFQSFIVFISEDFGLSEVGYKMTSHEFKGDTLFSHWLPPDKMSNVLGTFTLGVYNKKTVFTELKNPDETIIMKSRYGDHILWNGGNLPSKVFTIRYADGDSIIEKIEYSNPQFDIPISEEFNLPSDISVKEIEW